MAMAGLWRCTLGAAALIAAGAANWVDPPPISEHSGDSAPPAQVAALPPSSPGDTTAPPPIAVTEWGFGERPSGGQPALWAGTAAPGRPLYLWMKLDGTQAAVDRLRTEGRLAIEVHWTRDAGAGAPNLVTELTVGRPDLAPTFAEQVRRKGSFEWHSWARKDALSRGKWARRHAAGTAAVLDYPGLCDSAAANASSISAAARSSCASVVLIGGTKRKTLPWRRWLKMSPCSKQ